LAIDDKFGRVTEPVKYLIELFPIHFGLLIIDLIQKYFAAICKAIGTEILAAFTSAGVSMMP
jgi:hypothetical protein